VRRSTVVEFFLVFFLAFYYKRCHGSPVWSYSSLTNVNTECVALFLDLTSAISSSPLCGLVLYAALD